MSDLVGNPVDRFSRIVANIRMFGNWNPNIAAHVSVISMMSTKSWEFFKTQYQQNGF